MDELKEIYGIELTVEEKKTAAICILTNEWEKTVNTLAKASNRTQRVEALINQEAIRYALSMIGGRE